MSATVHNCITTIYLCQVVFYLHFALFSVEDARGLCYNRQNEAFAAYAAPEVL